jgi:hypothetical protein
MSNQITTAFVEQYSNNVTMLSQQMGSVLRPAVDVETVNGKKAFFEQIGQVTAQVRTSRHSDTPQLDTPHARRSVTLADYEWADLIDDVDKIRMLIDPALGGTAKTGVTGSTDTALPSAQKPFSSSQGDTTAGALSVAKLTEAKFLLDSKSVDPSLKRYFLCSPKQIQNLLGITEVTSADFNTVRALAQGDVTSFMGFEFLVSNRLQLANTDDRLCYAFTEDAIKLAIGKDVTARIDERADKGYSTQVYYCMSIGATRMEEEKVVEVACDE